MKIISSVRSFIKDSWESHMIVFIITSILLVIPDRWLLFVIGYSIPESWKIVIFIFFILSIVLLIFDIISYIKRLKKQIVSLNNKFDLNDYELDQDNGWFSHKERGGKFCPKCLSKEKEVPLIVDKAGWDCPVCKEDRITLKGSERFGTIYSP